MIHYIYTSLSMLHGHIEKKKLSASLKKKEKKKEKGYQFGMAS